MSMLIINGNKKVYHGGGHQAAMREDFQNMVHHMMFQMWAASLGFLQCYVVGGHVNDFWDGIATPIKEPFTKDKMNDCSSSWRRSWRRCTMVMSKSSPP